MGTFVFIFNTTSIIGWQQSIRFEAIAIGTTNQNPAEKKDFFIKRAIPKLWEVERETADKMGTASGAPKRIRRAKRRVPNA